MMTQAGFVSTDDMRGAFSDAMSAMYRAEVPLYGDLIDIVDTVNRQVLTANSPDTEPGDFGRLGAERHGAIRLGTAAELSMMRRAFAVLGMQPVGYYDLSVAGVPVHSTAFRPITAAALDRSPFRVFTSLLRLELIDDAALRERAEAILALRQIFSPLAIELIEKYERQGGLGRADADAFVPTLLQTFRWHGDALVDADTYGRLLTAHRLVADIVSFRGPHINHLTPRTLDIDAAQAEMRRRGMAAKDVVEGPPRRKVPILLRQTSFRALEEPIRFQPGEGGEQGSHTARFGEIEQRGVALTPKGRALYDDLLDRARGDHGSQSADYAERLRQVFTAFPDNHDDLRAQGLAFYRYSLTDRNGAPGPDADLEQLIRAGRVIVQPITYEDFLPVSAAGIFQSNLGGAEQASYAAHGARSAFEKALGAPVLDEMALYAAEQEQSLADVLAA